MPFNDELEFEKALVELLTEHCGWEKEIIKYPTEEDLIKNWSSILYNNNKELDVLNGCPLTEGEMSQIMTQISNKTPTALNEFINGKTVSIKRDNVNDKLHFEKEVSLKIYDRDEIAGGKSRYQIAEQPIFKAQNNIYPNRRGDIMLLINGMPVFHIELKKTGIPISHATTQIEKYMHERVFTGIFSLVQIFVAMNPEESLYFANPGKDGLFNSDFFFHWANVNNEPINDWDKFTRDFLSIPMAHEMVGFYTIADDTDGILKVMRSYQFYAASKISDAVKRSHWNRNDSRGGYIWHTTGSGKTMTSFKAAQLIANSKDAQKVVFLIDRIELGTQSLKEYRNYADTNTEVQETDNTDDLITKLKSDNVDDTLIVTSIQKMSRIVEESTKAKDLEIIRSKKIVFIIDECHRSTAGEMLYNIRNTFPTAMYFGFSGTPILDENHRIIKTSDIFGDELHRYTIVHGIKDKNVLGFDPYKVCTFNDADLRLEVGLKAVNARNLDEVYANEEKTKVFNEIQNLDMVEIEKKIPAVQYKTINHKDAIVSDILKNWIILSNNYKLHAILATSSILEAIELYSYFKKRKDELTRHLKITAVFDPSDNNSESSIEKIDGIAEIIEDYNNMYNQNFSISTYGSFKKDVSSRLAHKKPYLNIENNSNKTLDLVIVVDQMLTGFDSKWVNTLYLDKRLSEDSLIQAFSRTNRVLNSAIKPFGVIKYYRYPHTMEKNIEEAVKMYSGDTPYGLFVVKLDNNLKHMNDRYLSIKEVFVSAGIPDYSRLPETVAEKEAFAKSFSEFNTYYEAARVQGFVWKQKSYRFEKEDNIEEIEVLITENEYLMFVQRYKELFSSGSGGMEPLPFDINGNITSIRTDRIDSDYVNSKFKLYLIQLDCGNAEAKEKTLNDLHNAFARLSQEDQKYANLFLHDLQNGQYIIDDDNKTLTEYISDYKTKVKNDQIHKLSSLLGVDENKLRKLMNVGVNQANINEYGRYDELFSSLDIDKAVDYFSNQNGKEIEKYEANMLADELLRKFILNSGFDL